MTGAFTAERQADGTVVARWNDPAGGRFHAELRDDAYAKQAGGDWRVFARYTSRGVPVEVTGRGSVLAERVTDPGAIAALDLAAGVNR